MKKCFIVCPIGNDGSETRERSDKLFKHIILPVCQDCEFEPIRIDQENNHGSITDDIFKHLREDELVIADLTEHNPNAFYEMGYRMALNKPVIHLIMKDSPIPFDVASIRFFTYNLTDIDNVVELKTRLVQVVNGLNFDETQTESENAATKAITFNATLLQEVYRIQDGVTKLTELVKHKDNTAVSILADKIASANAKSPETMLIETLLSKIIDNPEKLIELAELSKKLSK